MCLAIPVKVEKILDGDLAIVSIGGLKKQISVALIDELKVGDYVILHVGYALSKIDPAEAKKTLALFNEMDKTEGTQSEQGEWR